MSGFFGLTATDGVAYSRTGFGSGVTCCDASTWGLESAPAAIGARSAPMSAMNKSGRFMAISFVEPRFLEAGRRLPRMNAGLSCLRGLGCVHPRPLGADSGRRVGGGLEAGRVHREAGEQAAGGEEAPGDDSERAAPAGPDHAQDCAGSRARLRGPGQAAGRAG